MNKRLLHALMVLSLAPSITFAQELTGFGAKNAEKQKTLEKTFSQTIDFGKFKQHLIQLTSEPHTAGSEANERVKDYIVKQSKNAGWQVDVHPYDVYLSPRPGESLVELVSPHRKPLNQQEDILAADPYSNHPDLWKGWNAYSGSGDVTAEVVYANYGTKADFEKLKELGIDVKGKVVLARYGANFRGYKAKFAEEYGAAALLIFTDPGDSGYAKGLVYPEGIYYNESSIQRGSLLTADWTGDPLTPFEPALPLDGKKKIKRLNPEEVGLPKIPVTPIPYGSAKEIMEQMKGKAVPAGWQGGLPFTYRLDGGKEFKLG
jgi:N-acetylated-alpha-linked acidic dipeptidase